MHYKYYHKKLITSLFDVLELLIKCYNHLPTLTTTYFLISRMYKQIKGWTLLVLMISSSVISTLAYPNQHIERGFQPSRGPQLPAQRIERKFVEKPNAIKKVALDDIETNEIQEQEPGFTWSSLLGKINLLKTHADTYIDIIFDIVLLRPIARFLRESVPVLCLLFFLKQRM